MSRFEECVIGVLLVVFIVFLAAMALDIWPLWLPVAMLVWAFLIHIGVVE